MLNLKVFYGFRYPFFLNRRMYFCAYKSYPAPPFSREFFSRNSVFQAISIILLFLQGHCWDSFLLTYNKRL